MLYEIKIEDSQNGDGSFSLERLASLASSLQSIAKGALQIRLGGMSNWRGRSSSRIHSAVEIRLSSIKKGSSVLNLECDTFRESLAGQQGDAFRPLILEELPSHTPMSLIIESFKDALDEKGSEEFLDKPLLHELQNFQKVFLNKHESISFAAGGKKSALQLDKKKLNKIRTLEDRTPNPKSILVKGLVETLKYSNSKVTIQMEDGRVDAFLPEHMKAETVGKYWGKQLTIAGTAHYRPSGRTAYIDIDRIFPPGKGDEYFSKHKSSEVAEEQIKRQLSKHEFQNKLSELIGQWPGDESFDDLQKQLRS